jgi:dimethylhistidine N-methyltransferase
MLPSGKHPWHFFSHAQDVPSVVVATKAGQAERRQELEAGLFAEQAVIPPKFFYDAQGCALYSAICALDEYYPIKAEAEIFRRHRADIAAHVPRRAQWVDLGCADGGKSWPWLELVGAARYVGVDISEDWLRIALCDSTRRFPALDCMGIVADFTRPLHLPAVKASARKQPPVFFYPGSSIGNFAPADTLHFLQSVQQHLGEQGQLLISVDGPRDPAVLEAAYDDALGVTAAFNRNILRAVNREFDADFAPELFEHLAVYNSDESRIEMYLEASATHTVRIGNRKRRFDAGETILTEYSYKYTGKAFNALLEVSGYGNIRLWSSDDDSYHVFLAGTRKLS